MTRPPGGRGGKSDAERAHYLEHGAEAWIAVLRQGFVESFAGQSRFFRELHHAASACDFTERGGKERRVVRRLIQACRDVGRHGGFGFQVVGGIPLGETLFSR